MSEEKMYFWSDDPNGETLLSSLNDAVYNYLDQLDKGDFQTLWTSNALVRIFIFKQAEPPTANACRVLDLVLEDMDEDYLPENVDATEQTDEMMSITENYLEEIRSVYPRVAWTHKKGDVADINILEWIAENNPHWIKKIERS